MILRRSHSAGDVRQPLPPLRGPDHPALSPTDAPHRRNVDVAEGRPLLAGLALLAFEPIDHARQQGPIFRPVPRDDEPPSVIRLPDCNGRPHAIFSSQLYQAVLQEAGDFLEQVRHGPNPGENATYIPQLADCDADALSASIVAPNGAQRSFGQHVRFTVQSVCKMFLLTSAIRARGLDEVERWVAACYSPHPFHAPCTVGLLGHPLLTHALACTQPGSTSALLAMLEAAGDRRIVNASCNLGAIAMTMLLPGDAVARLADLMRFIGSLCPPRADVRETVATAHWVYGSEIRSTAGNQLRARVAARLMSDSTHRGDDLPLRAFQEMEAYIAACSLEMDCSGVAAAYASLCAGQNVFTEAPLIDAEQASFVVEQMKIGGLYESSREFFERTGWVAKSGVSGVIAAFCQVTRLTLAVQASHVDSIGNGTRAMAWLRLVAASKSYRALRSACLQASTRPAAPLTNA